MKKYNPKPASLFPDDDEAVGSVKLSKSSDRPKTLSTSCYEIFKKIIKQYFLLTD